MQFKANTRKFEKKKKRFLNQLVGRDPEYSKIKNLQMFAKICRCSAKIYTFLRKSIDFGENLPIFAKIINFCENMPIFAKICRFFCENLPIFAKKMQIFAKIRNFCENL